MTATIVVQQGCASKDTSFDPPAPQSTLQSPPTRTVPTPSGTREATPPTKREPARVCTDQTRAHLLRALALPAADPRVSIEDPRHNLQRFHRAWTELLARPGGKRKLRVAIYGDSNTQGDWAAAFLRKLLGAELGLGGHGFIGAGAPNKWYEHRAIRSKHSRWWRTFSVTSFGSDPKAPFGHAGFVSIGQTRGARVDLFPANGNESPVVDNERFSRVEIHYLCEPGGGSFDVVIDNEPRRSVDTNCAQSTYSIARLEVALAKHRVALVTRKPRVAVFGLVLENDAPGIVIDGLGINTGNYKWLLRADPTMFEAGLRARGYDLVVLATGTSMWAEMDHQGLAAQLIGRIRKALGTDVSILVMTPGVWGDRKHDKLIARDHIERVVKEKREVAQRHGCAFWNYHRAMGGDRALPHLVATNQIYRDLLHFPPITHLKMMRRLNAALHASLLDHFAATGIDCGGDGVKLFKFLASP